MEFILNLILEILISCFFDSAFANTLPSTPTSSATKQTQLKDQLTPMQYYVTQQKGTEPAFQNEYWNKKEPGIYVDVVSGIPLFSSLDKYDSKTGWPSFTKPLEPNNINYAPDRGMIIERTEVISKSGSHLGHVFDDGPAPTFNRFCINSAALKFIPAKDLEKQGYGKYVPLFQGKSN